jgi:CubicO group peptidase (beta-lactamase class C family)
MDGIGEAVEELLVRQVRDGTQIGVQVCAYVHGERVVDVVAGTMGPGDDRPVEPDSLFLSWSSTKGPAALLVHQLADRGAVDLNAPVAAYWPAFAANGKDQVTVAQAMSHQVGLHAMPKPFAIDQVLDWDASVERMEQGVPAWEPGTATGYHAMTWGWIVGGLVAAVTGRHIQELFRTEIAEPLGVADELFVGIPDDPDVVRRLASLEIVAPSEGVAMEIPEDSMFLEAMPVEPFQHFNSMPVRQACMPAANGHFTARALATMYGALANGGELGGTRLVSADAIEHMQELQTDEVDQVLGYAIRKNTGFFLGGLGPDLDGNLVHGAMGPRETAFGHSGAGGSTGFADPDVGLGMAVTLNKMSYPLPGEGVTQEICDLVRSLI